MPNSSPSTASRGRAGAACADRLLDGTVGVADRREVGLGLDLEVKRLKRCIVIVVGGVGETDRQVEVAGIACRIVRHAQHVTVGR